METPSIIPFISQPASGRTQVGEWLISNKIGFPDFRAAGVIAAVSF
jgi:hypothetical protein